MRLKGSGTLREEIIESINVNPLLQGSSAQCPFNSI
jgi:hypothetical protein